MPKPKSSRVLFEVIDTIDQGRKAQQMSVPKWFKGVRSDQPEEADAPPGPSGEPRFNLVREPVGRLDVPPDPAPGDPRGSVQSAAGRLVFSLTPTQLSVAAGILVVFVLASFLIGWGLSGSDSAGKAVADADPDSAAALLNQPINQRVLGDQQAGTATLMSQRPGGPAGREPQPTVNPSNPPVAGPAAQPGPSAPPAGQNQAAVDSRLHYIVIESFDPKHQASAEFVRKLLAQWELDTRVERTGKRLLLVTTLGYDFEQAGQKEQADKFVAELKGLGPVISKALIQEGLPNYDLRAPYARR